MTDTTLTTAESTGIPSDVLAALDRMCTPLHESRLKGATAEADAHCMKIIRDYIFAASEARDVGEESLALKIALDALWTYQSNWDTGLPAAYAEGERVMMECACEAVRDALNDALATRASEAAPTQQPSNAVTEALDEATAAQAEGREPIVWISAEQLRQVTELTSDAWVYWRESGHVAEPDEIPLFVGPARKAAPVAVGDAKPVYQIEQATGAWLDVNEEEWLELGPDYGRIVCLAAQAAPDALTEEQLKSIFFETIGKGGSYRDFGHAILATQAAHDAPFIYQVYEENGWRDVSLALYERTSGLNRRIVSIGLSSQAAPSAPDAPAVDVAVDVYGGLQERALLATGQWANADTPVPMALAYREGFVAGASQRAALEAQQASEPDDGVLGRLADACGLYGVRAAAVAYAREAFKIYAAPQPAPAEALTEAALRDALAWGRAYGDAIPAHQWGEMRDAKVKQILAALTPDAAKGEQQQ